jgi:hypothetical protein
MPRKPEIGSGPEVSLSGIYQPESGPYHGSGLRRGKSSAPVTIRSVKEKM